MTPTNEAGHGLPELPEPLISGGNDNSRPDLGRGCTGYTADQMRQYARDALALSRGVPDSNSSSLLNLLEHAEGKLRVYSEGSGRHDTELSCMILPAIRRALRDAPAAAGAQGEAVCSNCNGRGEVGGPVGQTAETFDYVTEPCPECTPQPAAADGGVRERAQSERHLDGLRISLCLGGVRLLSGPFDSPKAHGEAMRAINDSLSSHRQAGDESLDALHSRFLSDTSGLPDEWQDWRNDFARDIRALVEKGAG